MKTKTFKIKSITIASLAGGIATLLSACGGQAYRPSAAVNDLAQQPLNQPQFTLPNNQGQYSPQANNQYYPTGSQTRYNPQTGRYEDVSNDTGIYPVSSESFEVTGPRGAKPTYTSQTQVVTDNLLRVKISAGVPTNAIYGAQAQLGATYDCVKFRVTVAGQSQDAYVSISNGSASSPCMGQYSSQAIIDFSNRLSPGHSGYQVSVQAVAYDNNCQTGIQYFNAGMFTWNQMMQYCITGYLHEVESVHLVTGHLEIQTNGSRSL